MTDLTEQWKKGELLEGYYYVKDGENMIAEYLDGYFYNDGLPMTSFSGGVDKVLAKIPTYQEYLALQSDSLAKNEASEIIAELEAKVKKLRKDYKDLEFKLRSYKDFKETAYDLDTSRLEEEIKELKERNNSLNNRDINLCRIANGIRNENFALKELLKECKEVIKNVDTYYGNYDSTNGFLIVEKINQALGEDK